MSQLKDHLIDELDYVLLPKEGWEKVSSWYGTTTGQDPVARKVVEHGMFVKRCKVEVYLMEFKLCENSQLDHIVTSKFSKGDTIGMYCVVGNFLLLGTWGAGMKGEWTREML